MNIINLNIGPNEPWSKVRYPAGELGLTLQPPTAGAPDILQARVNTPERLLDLLLAVNALRGFYGKVPATLRLGYLPYSRQDRQDITGNAFGLGVVAGLLDNLGFTTIQVLDPHSDVSAACFRSSIFEAISPDYLFSNWLNMYGPKRFSLMVPSLGAINRCATMTHREEKKIDSVLFGAKSGDGTLNIYGDPAAMDRLRDDLSIAIVVVDDVCDGGGEFIRLLDILESRGISTAGRSYLFATHGIFSGYALTNLPARFKSIGTTDSFSAVDNAKVQVLPYFWQPATV